MVQNLELYQPVLSKQMPLPTMTDYSRPTTPENGTNGIITPRTPKNRAFALTEYTANPSPPSESTKPKTNQVVPEAFLLPNGYPDVCNFYFVLFVMNKHLSNHDIVPPPHPHLPRLRSRPRNSSHRSCESQQQTGMQYPTQARRPPTRVQLQAARSI